MDLAEPLVRKNPSRLKLLISDDFEEIGSSGKVYKKSDILEQLPLMNSVSYKLSEFSFINLSNNCVLVKYRSSSLEKNTLRTSIWVKKNENWQILHHQSTVILNAI